MTYPDLVVRRDDNVMLAVENGGLGYGFESQSAFIDCFPQMLQELLPRVRREIDVESVRFRLTHNPARPVVEPVLRNLWFTPQRSWLGFSLAKNAPNKDGAYAWLDAMLSKPPQEAGLPRVSTDEMARRRDACTVAPPPRY